jgi:hypothetical protein
MKNKSIVLSACIIISLLATLVFSSFSAIFSIGPEINILSPENSTYLETSITLRFEVEEKPILIGYQLDDALIKWHMIREGEIASAIKIQNLITPGDLQFSDAWINPPGEKYIIGLQSLFNDSAEFATIENGMITKYVIRSSTTTPPLRIGVDLELFDEFVIYPLEFDFSSEILRVAWANKSDFTYLTNETHFEFNLENMTYGEHELTVFVIDKDGAENSISKSFTVEEPDIIIVANSVDYSNASSLIDYLKVNGHKPLRISSQRFSDYKDKDTILILGGPDAYDGVGEMVQEVLNETQHEAIRKNGSIKMFVKRDIWSEKQLIMVLAGSGRQETQKAHETKRTSVVNRIITKHLDKGGNTWVKIDPQQCYSPWGKSIIDSEIIKAYYYNNYGIFISDIKTKMYGPDVSVCMACGCPAGFTIYLLVPNPDVYKMLDFGYKISNSPLN